jgi:hypothetical protein
LINKKIKEIFLKSEFLYQLPGIGIISVLIIFMIIGSELGFWLGRRNSLNQNDATRSQIKSIQGAILGLLALLLSFTFAMSLSRFEYRKQMVVQESNAIATAALRSEFLTEKLKNKIEEHFRRYVEIRLYSVLQTTQNSTSRAELDSEVSEIQLQLWKIASEASKAFPSSLPISLFVKSVNDMIDIKMTRDIAVANHVPESIYYFLLSFAVLSMVILGYSNGLTLKRILPLTISYSFIIALVILLIIDLDHPQQGLSRTSQQSMLQLNKVLDSKNVVP